MTYWISGEQRKNTLVVFWDLCHPVKPGCNKVVFQCKVGFFKSTFYFDYVGGFKYFLKMNILKNLNLQAILSCFVKYFNDVFLLHIQKSYEWTRFWEGQTTYCELEMGDTHKSHCGFGRPGEDFQVSCLVEVFQLKSRMGCYGFLVGAFSDENPLGFSTKTWANWKDIIPTEGPRKGSSKQGIFWKNWQQIVWCIMKCSKKREITKLRWETFGERRSLEENIHKSFWTNGTGENGCFQRGKIFRFRVYLIWGQFFTIWSRLEFHEMRLIPFVEIWWVYIGSIIVPQVIQILSCSFFVLSASKCIFILPTNW